MTAEEYKVEDVQVTPEVKADPAQDIQAAQPAEVVQSAQVQDTTPASQPQAQPMYEEGAERFSEETPVPTQTEVQPIQGGELDEFQVMDMLTQLHTNEIYNEAELRKAGIESKMRAATTYYEQKDYELGVKQYHLAKRNAIRESAYTGTYISPEMSDLIAQETKAWDDIDNPSLPESAKSRARAVLTKVDSYFKNTGVSRTGRKTLAKIAMEAQEASRRFELTLKTAEVNRMRTAMDKAIAQSLEVEILGGMSLDDAIEIYGHEISEEDILTMYNSTIGHEVEAYSSGAKPMTPEGEAMVSNFYDGTEMELVKGYGSLKVYSMTKQHNGAEHTVYVVDNGTEQKFMTHPEKGTLVMNSADAHKYADDMITNWADTISASDTEYAKWKADIEANENNINSATFKKDTDTSYEGYLKMKEEKRAKQQAIVDFEDQKKGGITGGTSTEWDHDKQGLLAGEGKATKDIVFDAAVAVGGFYADKYGKAGAKLAKELYTRGSAAGKLYTDIGSSIGNKIFEEMKARGELPAELAIKSTQGGMDIAEFLMNKGIQAGKEYSEFAIKTYSDLGSRLTSELYNRSTAAGELYMDTGKAIMDSVSDTIIDRGTDPAKFIVGTADTAGRIAYQGGEIILEGTKKAGELTTAVFNKIKEEYYSDTSAMKVLKPVAKDINNMIINYLQKEGTEYSTVGNAYEYILRQLRVIQQTK